MSARYLIADVFDGLASLPDNSVDLVVTSPPFLALRSYLPADHPDKAKEIGSEPTPGAFLDALLDVTEALARVLAPHGSLCVELGDTYSGSGQGGGDYLAGGLRERTAGQAPAKNRNSEGWPEAKSLCLIPESYRFALAYGRNPFTGRETDPWRVRNVVRWHRPNPPVGALGDKFRPATSEMVVACKSKTRYFDLDAVRGPGSGNTHARTAKGVDVRPSTGKTADDERRGGSFSSLNTLHDTNGAPPLDTWIIPTAPYKGSHYATFPPALVVKPIKAMCPERVCRVCGEPSRRIVELEPIGCRTVGSASAGRGITGGDSGNPDKERALGADRVTTGWTDCGHDDWRRGVVLDPFAGSGTTLMVAEGHGRDSIGIDLDARNADLARDRVGMALGVEG